MLLPENAATELKRAYNSVVEMGVLTDSTSLRAPHHHAAEALVLYQRAMDSYRAQSPEMRLASERWARAAKHLAESCWHESKISHLLAHCSDLPYLTDALAEYHLHHETEAGAQALLDSCAPGLHPECSQSPIPLAALHERGNDHLRAMKGPGEPRHELLSAERIKAATQYGRALECVLLALEAENDGTSVHQAKAA